MQARDDITDGANDKEIDAVIVDHETRRVIIIQGKFYDAGTIDHRPLHEYSRHGFKLGIARDFKNCSQKLKVKLEAVAEALKTITTCNNWHANSSATR